MRRRRAVVLLAAYVVLSLVNIAAAIGGADLLVSVTYLLLMPLLAGFVLLAARRWDRLVALVVVALFWSWLGDWADWFLVLKIGFFLLAQVAYAMAFWPMRRRSVLTRPVRLTAYGTLIVFLIVALASQAGALAGPVAAYGVGLGVMAILATGVNRMVGLGAFLFLLSDIVLGVYFFVSPDAIPGALAINSALYLPAQLLLAVGVVRFTATRAVRRWRPVVSTRG